MSTFAWPGVPLTRPRYDVIEGVLRERHAQDIKWGEQNHPDGTDPLYDTYANAARDMCERRFAAGIGTWKDILAEEVSEAYAEIDPEKLRVELVQVAAVAVAWIEAIDRRSAGAPE